MISRFPDEIHFYAGPFFVYARGTTIDNSDGFAETHDDPIAAIRAYAAEIVADCDRVIAERDAKATSQPDCSDWLSQCRQQ